MERFSVEVAGPAAEPVAFPLRRFETAVRRDQVDFSIFTRLRQDSLQCDDLRSDVSPVPLASADGLGESIDGGVERMQGDLAAGAPGTARAGDVVQR